MKNIINLSNQVASTGRRSHAAPLAQSSVSLFMAFILVLLAFSTPSLLGGIAHAEEEEQEEEFDSIPYYPSQPNYRTAIAGGHADVQFKIGGEKGMVAFYLTLSRELQPLEPVLKTVSFAYCVEAYEDGEEREWGEDELKAGCVTEKNNFKLNVRTLVTTSVPYERTKGYQIAWHRQQGWGVILPPGKSDSSVYFQRSRLLTGFQGQMPEISVTLQYKYKWARFFGRDKHACDLKVVSFQGERDSDVTAIYLEFGRNWDHLMGIEVVDITTMSQLGLTEFPVDPFRICRGNMDYRIVQVRGGQVEKSPWKKAIRVGAPRGY